MGGVNSMKRKTFEGAIINGNFDVSVEPLYHDNKEERR
jgi:hypothetical protein